MNYRDLKDQELPYDGEFFFSQNKKYKELIFFVHFYEGSKRQLLRHIRFVNQLGFDAFAFNLQGDFRDLEKLKLPFTPNKKYGLKHAYAYQIGELLNLIPGDKIIYSFSNPSGSAIEAIRERNFRDIKALVCDSGPSGYFVRSGINLFRYDLKDRVTLPFLLFSPLITLSWSPFLHLDIHKDLSKFPKDFPIFTIEGEKDLLIPPPHIEKIFQKHKQLNWNRKILPLAGHLNGLRDFKVDYENAVVPFLKKVSTQDSLES